MLPCDSGEPADERAAGRGAVYQQDPGRGGGAREEPRPGSVVVKSPYFPLETLAQPPGSLAAGRARPRGHRG